MEFKTKEKYFTAKGGGIVFLVGLALAALGIVALAISPELMTVAIILLAVGIVTAFVSSSKKVKDKDIDDAMARDAKAFEEEFVDKYITDHSRAAGLKRSEDAPKPKRRGKPEYFGNFWFSGAKYNKRGGDGKYRSSIYCFSGVLVDPDELSVACRMSSLVEDDKTETWEKAPFAELAKAELADAPADDAYTQARRYIYLRVTRRNGELFADIPVTANADADRLVAEINQAISRF
ncbi:MAG: hypothetical protein IKL84_03735 [Clostridia bacterium]|nr:hypothetical protein [Clostridia bacterium]